MKVLAPKDAIMQPTMKGPLGNTHVLGTNKPAPGADKKANSETIELARRDKAEARFSALKNGIAALKSKVGQEEAILQLVGTDEKGRGQEYWEKLFATSTKASVDNLEIELGSMRTRYEGQDWFSGNDPMDAKKNPRKLRPRKRIKKKQTPEQQRGRLK